MFYQKTTGILEAHVKLWCYVFNENKPDKPVVTALTSAVKSSLGIVSPLLAKSWTTVPVSSTAFSKPLSGLVVVSEAPGVAFGVSVLPPSFSLALAPISASRDTWKLNNPIDYSWSLLWIMINLLQWNSL